jgi:putative peptidoglycan lipid II flippase
MSRGLARSAGIIGLATLSSRLLGLARDMLFAAYFGTGHMMDAFNVASRVPNLLRDLFAEGAMSAAFVPTFTRELTRSGKAAAWRLGSQVLNALLLITGAIVVVGILFAGPFMRVYAGEYAAVPGKLELTTAMTRITMPFLTLVALAAALMGMLNSLRRFFVPSLSPATFNVVMIACVVGLYPIFTGWGWPPVYSLAVGTVLGGVAQILTQVPILYREGYRHQWTLDFSDPALRQVLLLMGPGTLGVAAGQINMFVNTLLATSEPGNAVSWLQYAFRLMYLPIGIFGVSIATAAIPDLARQAAEHRPDQMRATISAAVRLSLMLGVPAAVGLMALSSPIVELLFQRYAFDALSTAMVAAALVFYAPGLIGYSIVKLASPSFYALNDARTPVMVSVLSIFTNLGLNLLLVQVLGFRGLALGTSIAAGINAGLLLWLLARRIDGVDGRRIGIALAKIAVASFAMGVAAYYAELWLRGVLPDAAAMPTTLGRLGVRSARVFGGIGVGLAVLALASQLLRIDEFQQAVGRLLRRLRA